MSPAVALAQPRIAVERLAIMDLASDLTHAGDGSGRLFIAEQSGRVLIYQSSALLPIPFVDITGLVSTGSERGLLGVAFHPQYETNGYFFVNYTDLAGDTVVARYHVSSDPNRADPSSALVVLAIPQPYANNKGGQLQFGPDGYLYIGMGDGGGTGDPQDRAQDLSSLLGKMLRIAPNVTSANPAEPYAVPASNPFVGQPGARPEIWAIGLRNPRRFTFDRATGDLFIGDAGELREEVDLEPVGSTGGRNYGWPFMDASACYRPASNCNPGNLILPIIEYQRSPGSAPECTMTGGYRYRGTAIPELTGWYLYGGRCSGEIDGAQPSGAVWNSSVLTFTSGIYDRLIAFGEDETGELFILAKEYIFAGALGGLYRIVRNNTLYVSDVATSEGTGEARLNVKLVGTGYPPPVVVAYSIQAGTATTGSDYTAVSGQLDFSQGMPRTQVVKVPLLPDALDEDPETFFLRLSAPVNATLGDAEGVGTIVDDDPPPSVSVNDSVVKEGNVGTAPATFGLNLSAPSGRTVTIPYATSDGNATAGSDYTGTAGVLSIPAGQTIASVSVPVHGDVLDEPAEAFLLTLAASATAIPARGVAQGTIADDDGRPSICQPILTLPYTITAQGRYCFVRNLSTGQTSGAAITINSDFVVLDLKGFKLGGGGAGPGTEATGVWALNRRNLTVRNGNIRGFQRGINFYDPTADASASHGHVLEGLRLDENTYAALDINGTGTIIRGNQIVKTGGTTAMGVDANVFGILSRGPGMRILGNDVSDTVGVGAGTGHAIALLGTSAVVERNRLANEAAPLASVGIQLAGSDNQVVNNRISLFGNGVYFSGGSTGPYRDNVTSGVGTPYTGGTNAGNNQ
jgi:glucose/arabinose dehydrogenase